LNTTQAFGYRDIYQTPDSSLYFAVKEDQTPESKRHYDLQMLGEDASEQLQTVQPWEEQPESLSTTFGDPGKFALRPPPDHKSAPGPKRSPAQRAKAETRIRRPPRLMRNWLLEGPEESVEFRAETGVEEGQRMREHSYAHALDVHSHMSIPVNAPPVDKLLDLGLDSMPVIANSVLTPNEVRKLQEDHRNMRDIVLSRAQRCPFRDCGELFPVGDSADAIEQHLQDKHVAEKCNFGCGEPLFAYWAPEQRYQHFVQEHSAVLRSMVPTENDYRLELPGRKRTVRAGEGQWNFCLRCGRNHATLDAPADRANHDHVCYPGALDRDPDWLACGICGEGLHGGIHGGGVTHKHKEGVEEDTPFCGDCGLPLGRFSDAYQVKHLSFCKGRGRGRTKYCPWCGIQLDGDFDARTEHMEGCPRKPSDKAKGPVDTGSRSGSQGEKPKGGKPATVVDKAKKAPKKK
jgi:hypothetical protein